MKFYIASTFERREEVRKMQELVMSRGHEITTDWTQHKPISPYADNIPTAESYTVEDVEGVLKSDVFVLVQAAGGTGRFVELGAAIVSHQLFGKPEIYIIGDKLDSMFFYHPAVQRGLTIDMILENIDGRGQQ